MARQIKLLWDFFGPEARKTAEHHEQHLKEFAQREKFNLITSGVEQFAPQGYAAFMVVPETEMIAARDALKPKRGEVYHPSQGKE